MKSIIDRKVKNHIKIMRRVIIKEPVALRHMRSLIIEDSYKYFLDENIKPDDAIWLLFTAEASCGGMSRSCYDRYLFVANDNRMLRVAIYPVDNPRRKVPIITSTQQRFHMWLYGNTIFSLHDSVKRAIGKWYENF